SYYLNDPVTGHVAILITSNERKSNHYEYDAFGNKKNNQRSLANAYGFYNADTDPETGLIYLEGRYYDPQVGRFLTKDTELSCLQNPQQLNPYSLKTNTGPSRVEPKDESYKIALAPSFQGVSHQKTKAIMSELRDLEGVVLDRTCGQIILFGEDKPHQQPLSLAALYHVLSNEHKMGVYTENTGSEEISKVNYLGPTLSTHVGNVLYEADRLVKNLIVGIDNITGEIVTSHVPGYKTFIDRCLESDIMGAITHEHWLFPEKLSLLTSTDDSALFVSELKMGMSSNAWHNNNLLNHAVVGTYRTHFVDHFDELAEEHPLLGSLATLEKLIGIGKWAQLQNLQIDASLFDLASTYATPDQTNIYLARKNKFPMVENGPNAKYKKRAYYDAHYLTIAENGGILCDLSPEKIQIATSELIDDLQGAILQSRPTETDFVWKTNGYTAVAQTLFLTPKLGNVRKTYTDMSFPVLGNNRLELTRSYNAFDEKWEWTPASLKVIAAGIVLSEHGREILYTKDAETPSLYRSADSPHNLVQSESGSFLLDKGLEGKTSFNAEGRLTQLTDGNGFSIRYGYEGDRLVSIAHQNGRTISLFYKDGILLRAVGPGGKALYYKHNSKGQLTAVADRRWNLSSYEYDEQGRLAKIFDAKDQLTLTLKYDIYNRAIEENGEVRRFNQRERKVEVQNPLNLVTTQEYDDHFRLVRAVDSQNRSVQLYYKEGMQA
ncbi:MAG TPA: RHS repeat-associated core domain-containing protein, partial [Rhabdochlamydiaceae bacterium]